MSFFFDVNYYSRLGFGIFSLRLDIPALALIPLRLNLRSLRFRTSMRTARSIMVKVDPKEINK